MFCLFKNIQLVCLKLRHSFYEQLLFIWSNISYIFSFPGDFKPEILKVEPYQHKLKFFKPLVLGWLLMGLIRSMTDHLLTDQLWHCPDKNRCKFRKLCVFFIIFILCVFDKFSQFWHFSYFWDFKCKNIIAFLLNLQSSNSLRTKSKKR